MADGTYYEGSFVEDEIHVSGDKERSHTSSSTCKQLKCNY